jgi:two-component system sensor histidine kinase BaeS
MTRRITLAILVTAVVALALAGFGTLVLARLQARTDTEDDLRRQAGELAQGVAQLAETGRPNANRPRPLLLNALKQALDLDDLTLMTFNRGGQTGDDPPAGLTIGDLDVAALLAGGTVSGNRGNLVYAAAAETGDRGAVAVVLTRQAGAGLRGAARWFLIASLLTIAVATALALWLSRRVTRPLREVQATAHRIAEGDLTARVPEPSPAQRDELADLQRSINTMAASLERSKGLEQQFLLSVSHDLRTPLTSIQGYAEAITDGATDNPAWAAGVIRQEAGRLDRLVRDLLDLGRLDARTFSLHLEPVDLGAVAVATADGFRPDAAAAGVELVADTVAALVQADADRLGQVAANLVENALRYARTKVTVGVRVAEGTAMLWVDDDGPGIASADLPHVFERLYVARHHPVRAESGSGLGLAIVRELVEAMGGSVAAEPAPGGGARLVVRLPTRSLPAPRPP